MAAIHLNVFGQQFAISRWMVIAATLIVLFHAAWIGLILLRARQTTTPRPTEKRSSTSSRDRSADP